MNEKRLATKCFNVETLRRAARRRLPRVVFDFADGGAEDETTLARNESDFDELEILPRMCRGTAERDTSVQLFGRRLALPVVIGPTGLSGMMWPRGEIVAARAAAAAGTVYTQSHGSTCTIEELAAAVPQGRWFQVFLYRDRGLTRSFMERAQASGAEALVLTIDNQILGQRERDLVNGFTIPPRVTARNAADMALSLPWLLTLGRGPGITFANYRGSAPSDDIRSLGAYIAQILDPGITWDDVAWVRGLWKGPLVVKGILHPEDAREAIAQGADGIVVSNHGGRQLDKAISSIRALPRVAEAVAGSAPLLIDGGVRRGTDILKAVALGATACLVGRPHLWGLAVAGEAGVAHVLDIFRRELDRAMALGGWRTLADIDGTALGASEPAARREGEAALRLAG